MKDQSGKEISNNTYWLADDDARYRKLNTLVPVKLTAAATERPTRQQIGAPQETVIDLRLTNGTTTPALATKAVLLNPKTGLPILPAYFSDNYTTLLPGETRTLTIHYPTQTSTGHPKIALRGWNIVETTIPVQ